MINIKEFHGFGTNRIEVALTNNQKLTLLVDPDSGKVSVLSDSPHMIATTVDVVQTEGRWKGQAMPTNVVEVKYYGYPSD